MAEPRVYVEISCHGIEKVEVSAPDEETRDESTILAISLINYLTDLDDAARENVSAGA